MPRVLFIADDFGISPEVNAAIVSCAGAIHGASLMVDQAATAGAVAMAKARPGIPVGLHLNFSDKREVGGKWDAFPWSAGPVATHLAAWDGKFADRFRSETRKQFGAYAATGLPLAFINAHHHLHVKPVVFEEIRRCLSEFFPGFDGWIRLGAVRMFGVPGWATKSLAPAMLGRDPTWSGRKTTVVWGSAFPFQISAKNLLKLAETATSGSHEVYIHPGTNKTDVRNGLLGDDGQDRTQDLAALQDARVINVAERSFPNGAGL